VLPVPQHMFQVSRSNWIDFVLHVIDPASSVGKNQNKQTRELFGNASGRLTILGNLRLLKGCRLMLRWWPPVCSVSRLGSVVLPNWNRAR